MSILVDINSRIVVQGITGKEGSFHAQRCIDFGTNVVAGVTPGKGSTLFMDSVPIFDTLEQAIDYVKKNKLDYNVIKEKEKKFKIKSYSDNFKYNRLK